MSKPMLIAKFSRYDRSMIDRFFYLQQLKNSGAEVSDHRAAGASPMWENQTGASCFDTSARTFSDTATL